MTDSAAVFSTLLLAHGGFACLAFAMDRHADLVFTRLHARTLPVIGLRMLGSVLLLLSLTPCELAWGATIGLVGWFGMLSAAAAAAAMLLRYTPKATRMIAVAASLLGLVILGVTSYA